MLFAACFAERELLAHARCGLYLQRRVQVFWPRLSRNRTLAVRDVTSVALLSCVVIFSSASHWVRRERLVSLCFPGVSSGSDAEKGDCHSLCSGGKVGF